LSYSSAHNPPWLHEDATYDYDAWRRYILSASPSTIRELVQKAVLPIDVLVCVLRSLLDDASDDGIREKAVGVLVYVILGSDLVPLKLWGPVGVLDDIWLLLSLLDDIFNRSNEEDLKRWWPGAEQDLTRVAKWVAVSQKVPKNLFKRGLEKLDGLKEKLVALRQFIR